MPRKARLTEETYIEAVRRCKSLDDTVISEYMHLNRVSVWRFSTDPENKGIVEKAKKELEEISNIRLDTRITFDLFQKIPSIASWKDRMENRSLGKKQVFNNMKRIYNICTYLKIHPDDLSVEDASKVILEMKRRQSEHLDIPSGLHWSTLRVGLRSFFQNVKGISGKLLADHGMDASDTPGSGSMARQRVTKEQRHKLEKTMIDWCVKYCNGDFAYHSGRTRPLDISYDQLYLEFMYYLKFMYYTGSRKMASLNAKLNSIGNKISNKMWKIEIFDKGKRSRKIRWEKTLLGFALDDFKDYTSKRFVIQDVDNEYQKVDFMFPILRSLDEHDITTIVKLALFDAGCVTNIAIHIWRHTFAQDFLEASDWNYELGAAIGGWVNANVMKKHYGEMGEGAKERGLRKSMGLPVEEVKYELRW